jgi:uncharacterized protein involved in exopolysaccharide biosynthesis
VPETGFSNNINRPGNYKLSKLKAMKNSEDILANNLLQLLRDLMKYWYLIVISLAIVIPLSILYLKYAAKTYRVTSSVLLSLKKTDLQAGELMIFYRLSANVHAGQNMQNEIYFMQSLPLIKGSCG